jgi:beta-fructofuranosidase
MVLRLPDKWIWDFWFALDGSDYHVFYLQAPRTLKDPDLRHWCVSIGHAVSQDLQNWQVLPDALSPSSSGITQPCEQAEGWDNLTTWTGSVLRHEGLWYLFYTGSCQAEKGLIQRVGFATSTDLIRWDKHPGNPCITADPRWYELLDLDIWHDQAWRDPWVFQHPATGDFHAYITARANAGPADGRGVIGHAWSSDLVHWEVQPPVTRPGEFGQMEVPQLVEIQERYYLLFSTVGEHHAAARNARTGLTPVTGTHYLVADDPLGPFYYVTDEFLVGDVIGSLYSGKLVPRPHGDWSFVAWRLFAPDGSFIGELSDPMPVLVDGQGRLSVDWYTKSTR